MSIYRELIVWQRAMELVTEVYLVSDLLPKNELYGLIMQMRRAAVSIPSNIAEGKRRGSNADYRRFLIMSFGSGAELETQVEIAKRLGFIKDADCVKLEMFLSEVMKMLNKMIMLLRI